MNQTKIEYLDFTWNPTVGCNGVGCAVRKECWARKISKRFKNRCVECYTFTPHYHWERLEQPLKVKKPARIGVGFNGDIYDSQFGICSHQRIFSVMKQASWHTFVSLTKQSENMLNFNECWQSFPENLWMGVTVNRNADKYRIEHLKATDAKIKFVSFEPLYEALRQIDFEGIDWVIIGGQTRPLLLPLPQWIDGIVEQATHLKIPIFFKDNLPLGYTNVIGREFPKATTEATEA